MKTRFMFAPISSVSLNTDVMLRKSLLIIFSVLSFSINAQVVSSAEISEEELELIGPMADSIEDPVEDKTLDNRTQRLMAKADGFYNKMWYAEASQIYDKILEENPGKSSRELLQKAGDAHYFNSNMKMANKWYEKLYKKHRKELDNEELFKYGHILQGVGRYAKAKRVMRIVEKQNSVDENRQSFEKEKLETLNKVKNVEVTNLDNNSPFSDFSPMFIENGSLVFSSSRDSSFLKTSRYKWNNQPYLDLYVGTIDKESPNKLDDIKKLDKNINSKYHEAATAITADGQTMYFTRNNYGKRLKRDKKGVNHLKLYKSVKIDGAWSKAMELPINSDNYSTGHPALSPDESKLYFVSDMPGGYGDTDIYVVDINEDGSFSPPRNLGKTVNSEEKEMFPFVTKDQLYFSSNRSFGMGGLDVYSSNYSNGLYQIAVNMGEPINSNKDDFSYIIDVSSHTGYFASNRKGGKGDDDIYYFKELSFETKTLNSAIVGVVYEKMTGKVISNANVQLLDNTNVIIAEAQSDDFGNFEFVDLNQGAEYIVRAEKEDYKEKTINLETENLEEVSANLLLERIENKDFVEEASEQYDLFEAKPIYFDFERYSLREMSKNELYNLALALKENSNMTIKIESHTDSRGSRAFNKWLSQERANATKSYLLELGVDSGQIESAIGYGEERPINDCGDGIRCSTQSHQENRRSEFIITNQ